MKKVFFIGIFLAVLGFSTLANADLINNGGNLIYDTDLNITWYAVSSNTTMGWVSANTWANSQTYGGVPTGWRLPTALNQDGTGPCKGYNCNGSEMGHLFYNELGGAAYKAIADIHNANYALFTNLTNQSGSIYWSGTQDGIGSMYIIDFFFANDRTYLNSGAQGTSPYSSYYSALAVHAGDVLGNGVVLPNGPISTPIPAAIWLFGAGLVGLVGVRRKFKK